MTLATAYVGRMRGQKRQWLLPTVRRAYWLKNGGMIIRQATPEEAQYVVAKPIPLAALPRLRPIGAIVDDRSESDDFVVDRDEKTDLPKTVAPIRAHEIKQENTQKRKSKR